MPTLSDTIQLYIQDRRASRYSEHTIQDYSTTYRLFAAWLDRDPEIREISAADIRGFLASREVSKKTCLNYHIGLSALWTWCIQHGLVDTHIVRQVAPPRPERRAIKPHTRAEFEQLLQACQGRQAVRDRAILLLLLDTGMRAGELCGIRLTQINLASRSVLVMGKGSKERYLKYSPETAEAIRAYLGPRKTGPLFLSDTGRPLDRHALRLMIGRVGERAGLIGCHPHRLRHTFAVQFLRNGGNIYILRAALGHSTLAMALRYLDLSQADLDSAMDHASPVACWYPPGSHP